MHHSPTFPLLHRLRPAAWCRAWAPGVALAAVMGVGPAVEARETPRTPPPPSSGVPAPSSGVPPPSSGIPAPSPGVPAPSSGVPAPPSGVPAPSSGVFTPSSGIFTPSSGVFTPSSGDHVDAAAFLADPSALVGWVQRHDQSVAAARDRVEQARSQVSQGELWLPNPQANMSLGGYPIGPTNPPGLALTQSVNLGVGVSQTFEAFKRGPRIRAAELGMHAQEESLVAAVHDRVATARLALGMAVFMKQRVVVLETALATGQEALALERLRQSKGASTSVDVARVELDQASLQADVEQARADLSQALGECHAALLASCDVDATTMDVLKVSVPDPVAHDRWLETLPEVRALGLESGAALETATLERRKILPDPTVNLGYMHDRFIISGNNPNVVMMGVSIPMPLFDRGQHTASQQEGRSRELLHTAQDVVSQRRAQLAGLAGREVLVDSALQQVRGEALPRARLVLDKTTSAFHLGEASLTDLLLARRAQTALKARELELQFQAFAVRNEMRRLLAVDAALLRPG